MKLISINISCLGGAAKKTEIRKLVLAEKPDFLFIQESKMESVDSKLRHRLWGSSNCNWVFLPSSGRSGGIIAIWACKSFQLVNSFSRLGYLGISGLYSGGISCNFIHVYSPCDLAGKRGLWSNIVTEIRSRGGDNWCVLGDFNAIVDPSERRGNYPIVHREIEEFNNFIHDAELNFLTSL